MGNMEFSFLGMDISFASFIVIQLSAMVFQGLLASTATLKIRYEGCFRTQDRRTFSVIFPRNQQSLKKYSAFFSYLPLADR